MPIDGVGPVVDADGHLVTDMDAIALRMPPEFINAERFFGLSERMAKRSV